MNRLALAAGLALASFAVRARAQAPGQFGQTDGGIYTPGTGTTGLPGTTDGGTDGGISAPGTGTSGLLSPGLPGSADAGVYGPGAGTTTPGLPGGTAGMPGTTAIPGTLGTPGTVTDGGADAGF